MNYSKIKIFISFIAGLCFTFSCLVSEATNYPFLGKDSIRNSNKSPNGWLFGVGFGSYFANKRTANYYNGGGQINNLNYTIMTNRINHDTLVQRFNGRDFYIDTTSLPQNMKYDIAINIEFQLRKILKDRYSVFFETGYSKLKTTDYVIIHINGNPNIPGSDENKAVLVGQEERFDINVGVSKEFTKGKISPFGSFGVNMNNVRVKTSQVQVQNKIFDLESPLYSMYNIKQGGVGFGVLGGFGFDAKFGNSGMVSLGWDFSYKGIKLDNYEKPLFNSVLYLKILMSGSTFFRNKN